MLTLDGLIYYVNVCINMYCSKAKHQATCRAIANGWQDSYSFTKAMAEMMLYEMRDDVPLVILRPSIIESAIKSPFPGWIQGNK